MSRIVGNLGIALSAIDTELDAVLARAEEKVRQWKSRVEQLGRVSIGGESGGSGATFGMSPAQRAAAGAAASQTFSGGSAGGFTGGATTPGSPWRLAFISGDIKSPQQLKAALGGAAQSEDISLNIPAAPPLMMQPPNPIRVGGSGIRGVRRMRREWLTDQDVQQPEWLHDRDVVPEEGEDEDKPQGRQPGRRFGRRMAVFFAYHNINRMLQTAQRERMGNLIMQTQGADAYLSHEMGQVTSDMTSGVGSFLREGITRMTNGGRFSVGGMKFDFNDQAKFEAIRQAQLGLRAADLRSTEMGQIATLRNAALNPLAQFQRERNQIGIEGASLQQQLSGARTSGNVEKQQEVESQIRVYNATAQQRMDEVNTRAGRTRRSILRSLPALAAEIGLQRGVAGEREFEAGLQDEEDNANPEMLPDIWERNILRRKARAANIGEDVRRRGSRTRAMAMRLGRSQLGGDLQDLSEDQTEAREDARNDDERHAVDTEFNVRIKQRIQQEDDRDNRIQLGLSGNRRALLTQLGDPFSLNPVAASLNNLVTGSESSMMQFAQAGKKGFAEQERANALLDVDVSEKRYSLGFRGESFDTRLRSMNPRDVEDFRSTFARFDAARKEITDFDPLADQQSPQGQGGDMKIDQQSIDNLARSIGSEIANQVAR